MDLSVPEERPSGKNDNGVIQAQYPRQSESILHPDRIAKNTSYLTVALVIQKILSLGYFIYISRVVGPESIGAYLTALAITTVAGFFIDLNFSQGIIRETAKQPQKTQEYANAACTIKLLLAIPAYACAQIYVYVFHLPAIVQTLVLITGIIMILDSFTLTFYSILRGHQKLHYEAIGTVINKVVVITFGVVGLRLGYGVHLLVLAILAGSLFNILYASILLRRKYRWSFSFQSVRKNSKYLARVALPWFALGGIFVTIYGYIDQILLTNPLLVGERGSSYLSWYGTAYKLTFSFQFIPAAVVAAIFPAMSAYYLFNKQKLIKTFERSLQYLCIIAVPLSLGIVVIADRVILAAYTRAYTASIIPLQILILSLIFIFLNYPAGYLLNATDRQRRNTIHIGIVMILNIVLNLILIPRYTFIGAAVASSCSSALLFLLNITVARKIINFHFSGFLITFLKTCVAAGTMAVGLWYLKNTLSIPMLIPIAATWYLVIIFILRGFSMEDGRSVFRLLTRRVAHQRSDDEGSLPHS